MLCLAPVQWPIGTMAVQPIVLGVPFLEPCPLGAIVVAASFGWGGRLCEPTWITLRLRKLICQTLLCVLAAAVGLAGGV